MPQIAYVNGRFVPFRTASVSIFDRGYVFGDGVYEVCAIFNGILYDAEAHWVRLGLSMEALRIPWPVALSALIALAQETIRRNCIDDGLLYLQITRGVAPRDHAFPAVAPRPALVLTAKRFDFSRRLQQQNSGIAIITMPDQRWDRVDIKSINLLPNVLAKQVAYEAGVQEAWLVNGRGEVTEGSSTNAWMVRKDDTIVTRPLGTDVLAGVMRQTLLRLIDEAGLKVEEQPFTLAEAIGAAELFQTSTTSPCLPIVSVDGLTIGSGTPGPVTRLLAQLLWDDIASQTGWIAY